MPNVAPDRPIYDCETQSWDSDWVSYVIAAIDWLSVAPGWANGDVAWQRSNELINWIVRGCDVSLPVGAIMLWAGAMPPDGWLWCDGTTYARASYPALAVVLDGTPFAINPTQFVTPDMRGRTPIGAGQGATLTNRTLGQQVGAETHTLTIAEMPSHAHGVTYSSGAGTGVWSVLPAPTSNRAQSQTVTNGGGQSHANMQPSIVLGFIVRATQ